MFSLLTIVIIVIGLAVVICLTECVRLTALIENEFSLANRNFMLPYDLDAVEYIHQNSYMTSQSYKNQQAFQFRLASQRFDRNRDLHKSGQILHSTTTQAQLQSLLATQSAGHNKLHSEIKE